MMIFPYFAETFDPQDQKEYLWRFLLLPGENLISAQLDQVDSSSTTVLSPQTMVFGPKTTAVISGNLWGVRQWFLPMSDGGFVAYVRCMIQTDYAGPIPHKYTRTMRITVGQL
jgi:hypothetical protein